MAFVETFKVKSLIKLRSLISLKEFLLTDLINKRLVEALEI